MLFMDNNVEKEDEKEKSCCSSSQLFNETEEFVIECAVFESQRWLEIVTGEGCSIPENLPKSLFEGKQLRKLVNLLLKREVFIFNTFQPPHTTIFERARIQHEFQNFIYDNDWISQFLIIANISFKIFPKYLFFHADLSNTSKSNKPLTSHNYQQQKQIEYLLLPSRDALRRICVTVLKLAKIYKEQYPDCNKTHIFDPEEGRKLLDLHKQKIGTHPIELQIRKRPRFTIATSPSMNFTNKKYGVQSLPRGTKTDLISRNRRNSDFNMQSCSTNSPLQDIIAANEDVERWRERRRRSMNRTSESEIIIEESKPLYSSINCCEPLHVQAPSPPPLSLPNLITHPYLKDTQEQIIIASPKQQQQRTEGSSQDSGLENSTPEVSPPGAAQSSSSSRNYWRNESESSLGSFSSDKFHLGTTATTTITTKPVLSASTESMTQKHLVSAKRSLAPSPPTETSAIQQFSSLTLETNPIECNANAKFICRKDYSEAAICKAVVAQGALEETSAKVKAIPMTIRTAQTGGKYSSVRIEVEATRENHAKVAAIKSVSAKEHQKTSGSFKPMCELIDEDLQRRRQSRSPCSLQSSISPASSSKSSDFGADNRSLDRMSFGSGGHLYGNDYKVVALNAKPEPGKLTEFVPEVERNKPSEREEYIVSSYGSANGATRSPPLDAAVVRNWELSDEELPNSKSPVNNNNTEKHVTTTAKIVEHVDTTKYDYPHLDRKFIRSQGYPTPFNANSKNYVKADSKFQILPKTEERVRPKIVKKDLSHQQQHQQPQQQTQPQPYGGSDTRRVHNDSRHPSGAPLPRIDLFSEEPKPLQEKSQSMLTVSGKLRCAHCTCELGRGSAMIIEALGLFYHINCFRCHVCDKMLGTGSQTTDVRVRDGKLHCEKCYSNEDIGVRLSEI